ncbi:MAG: type II toxin-antitoxin system VapC family toxin [Verrucomicrobiota bacterium]
MTLVDTSVWIDHLRNKVNFLHDLLLEEKVAIHPLIIGELACGNLRQRDEILMLLEFLPHTMVADHSEVMTFLDHHHLYGKGLGWIDLHLLASCTLSQTPFWTRDRRLQKEAQRLGISSRFK